MAACAALAPSTSAYAGGGDILRGGSTASSSTAASASSTTSSTAPITPGSVSAVDSLARASKAIQAVEAMQAQARLLALSASSPNNLGADPNHPGQTLPNVADGLSAPQIPSSGSTPAGPGLRLSVDANGNPVLLQGATAPVASTANPNQITVTQTQQQALIQWQTFDIGKNTTLTFNQSAGGSSVSNWIAFNYVSDPSGRPSQILGTINTTNGALDASGNAQVGGQVYVLNQNGIIFGGSSQVNAHSLVVSSLPINPNLVSAGLLSDTTSFQFLFSSSDITSTGQQVAAGTDAFGDASTSANYVAPPPTGGYGSVTVQPGAQLNSPALSGNVGGAVILVGPTVTNQGTISTPDGQTILAAGLQVALNPHNGVDPTRLGIEVSNGVLGTSPTGSDPSLRGLDVYIGAVTEPSVNTSNASGSAYSPLQYAQRADGGYGLTGSGWTGVVTNENSGGQAGVISAPYGDVTLAGSVVNQLGVINSSTSVALNGRVDLLSSYNAYALSQAPNQPSFEPFVQLSTGLVALGGASVTQILPDDSTTTVVGTQLTLPSQVYVVGHSIYLGSGGTSGTGALLLAPSGSVSMSAGDWKSLQGESVSNLVLDSGQINLDSGSVIDVSGSQDVSASVTQNIVSVQLRGTELADSPVQKGGVLQGATVQVDVTDTGTYNGQPWVGTPLAITTGYINLIPRTVGELTTNGGTVTLNAGGAVVEQAGSTLNVSGGWTNYQGAEVQTTELLSGGHVYNIAQATPNLVYTGIYTGTDSSTNAKWGTTQSSANPLPPGAYYENGYVQGGSGGAVTITAPSIAPEGSLLGYTVAGSHQVAPLPSAATLASVEAAGIDPKIWELSSLPAPSSLSLLFQGQTLATVAEAYVWYSPTPPNVEVTTPVAAFQGSLAFDPNATGAASSFPSGTFDTVYLSPALVQSKASNPSVISSGGFGTLNVENSDGGIAIPAVKGSTAPVLETQPGGSITMTGATVDIEGGVVAPGGSINFIAYDTSPYSTAEGVLTHEGSTPNYDPTRGTLTLGSGAYLSTAGLVVDNRVASNALSAQVNGGGSVALKASSVDLETGSSIDVSGGALVSGTGSVTYGSAGSIALAAGQDPYNGNLVISNSGALNPSGVSGAPTNAVLGGTLVVDAALTGYSGTSKGGSLSILAPSVQIGGTEPAGSATGASLWLPATASNVPFFSQGGFSSFSLTGIGQAVTGTSGTTYTPGLVVEPNTALDPVVQTWVANLGSGVVLTPFTQSQGLRPASSLTLKAEDVRDLFTSTLVVRGDLVVGAGATLAVDPVGSASNPTPAVSSEGSIALQGDTVDLAGTVEAPGGSIAVTGAQAFPAVNADLTNAHPTLLLEPTAVLSTSGQAVLVPDAYGRLSTDPIYSATGSVLGGGAITLTGNIVLEKGATIEANGSTGTLDLASGYSQISTVGYSLNPLGNLAATTVATSGGSITLVSGQELFSQATLSAQAGNPVIAKSVGGTLNLSGGYFNPSGDLQEAADATIVLTQAPVPFELTGGLSPTALVTDLSGNPYKPVVGTGNHVTSPLTYLDASGIESAGFSALNIVDLSSGTLPGALRFQGNVSLGASGSLALTGSGVVYANGTVALQAPYVALGQAFQAPVAAGSTAAVDPIGTFVAPVYGTGKLTVSATQLIDIGNLSLEGVGAALFNAGSGSIRGDGTLDVQGQIQMSAAEIYPPTAVTFNIAAYDYTATSGGATLPGTVTIGSGGTQQLPLSAAGSLNVYATTINQGGTLVAPLGSISLGTTSAVSDPVAGTSFPTTKSLTLESGSITSTSATSNALTNAATGAPDPIPYGINVNGTNWIDPTGTDITVTGNGLPGAGLPSQSVTLAGASISVQASTGSRSAAAINVSGGGDLLSYQWVPGAGGTVDILSPLVSTGASASYAILPGFAATYAPYAPNGGGSAGYTDGAAVGAQIVLNGSPGVPAGVYTLLPARYALLPGAYLVTPASGTPVGSVVQTDGSSLVSGFIVNGFSGGTPVSPLYANFDVASSAVVAKEAQYLTYSANTFFPQQAAAQSYSTPRLPQDAGLLSIAASTSINLQGALDGQAATGGLGSIVEINSSSSEAIDINATGTGTASNTFYLNSSELTGFSAQTLLIGGTFKFGTDGTQVTVGTQSLTVDNAGATLAAGDVILVASNALSVKPGSVITQEGSASSSIGTIQIGQLDASGNPVAGSGDGALVRVSANPAAQVNRVGVTPVLDATASTEPSLSVGAGAVIYGGTGSVTLDSTYATLLDNTSTSTFVGASSVNFASGQIALQLNAAYGPPATAELLISRNELNSLQASATSLSFLSYSTIDTFGSGSIGLLSASGTPTLSSIALHAGEIRSYVPGAGVVLNAQTITLDNGIGVAGFGPDSSAGSPSGTLTFNASTIHLGAALPSVAADASTVDQLNIDQLATVDLTASNGIIVQGSGGAGHGIAAEGALTLQTPLVYSATGASQTLSAGGLLSIVGTAASATTTTPVAGLGSNLTLEGSGVSIGANSTVSLPSGSLTLHATSADITVAGTLNAGGSVETLNNVSGTTGGGLVNLVSDAGNVTLSPGAVVNVAAPTIGGNAGKLTISAPTGSLTLGGALLGSAGAGGQAGSFALDTGSLNDASGQPTTSLGSVEAALAKGGFTQSQVIRVRNGDVLVDTSATANTFDLFADQGSIEVSGTINASGPVGGSINLAAGGSVTLDPGSALDASGVNFSSAGQGGAVTLAAGAAPLTSGTYAPNSKAFVTVSPQSTIDLSVANNLPLQLDLSGSSSITLPAKTVVAFPSGTPGDDEVTFTTAGTLTTASGSTTSFAAGYTAAIAPGSSVALGSGGQGTISFAASGSGGSVPISLPASTAIVSETGVTNLTAYNATGTLLLSAPQVFKNGKPVDVQINPIDGAVIDPSSIVVEGVQVFSPVGGVVDTVEGQVQTNGAQLAGGFDAAGVLQAGNTAAILSRLTANWGTGSGQVNPTLSVVPGALVHLQPGAEIVNTAGASPITLQPATGSSSVLAPGAAQTGVAPATTFSAGNGTQVSLNSGATTGSTIDVPQGSTLSFAQGTPTGDAVSFTGTGTITVGATTTPFTATGTVPYSTTLAAGATVTFTSSGSVAFYSGTTAVPIGLSSGSYTTAGSGTTSLSSGAGPAQTLQSGVPFTASTGSTISLNSAGALGSAVAFTGPSAVALPYGTPSGDLVSLIGSGTISSLPVAAQTLGSGTSFTAASGAGVALDAPGSIGSALQFPAGAVISLPSGVPTGEYLVFTASGSYVNNRNRTIPFTATPQNPFIFAAPAGYVFKLSGAGSLSVLDETASSPLPTTLTVSGGSYAASGAAATTYTPSSGSSETLSPGTAFSAASGSSVVLTAPDTLGSSLVTPSTTSTLTFSASAPAGDVLGLIGTGTVMASGGMPVSFTGTSNSPYEPTIAAGTVVQFTGSGTAAFISGSSAIPFTVTAGTYTTAGVGQTTLAAVPAATTPFTGTTLSPYVTSLAYGSVVSFSGAGNIGLYSGSSPVRVALPGGTYATAGGGTDTVTNSSGTLLLANSWDLSTLRFGPSASTIDPNTLLPTPVLGAGEPGLLTLRSAANVVLGYNPNANSGAGAFASLSDGFGGASAYGLWTQNLLPVASRSWSYTIVAGADFSAANVLAVQPLATLEATNTGSLELGSLDEPNIEATTSAADLRYEVIPQYYQVIRTGTGNIAVASGMDVQSLNPIATVYTAGQQAPQMAGFSTPDLQYNQTNILGSEQTPIYPAQYSFGGGNVSINAQRDIVQDNVASGVIVSDSSKQMPSNWLYRQGYVDANGNFAIVPSGGSGASGLIPNRPGTPNVASTSWWVDFSNYFEGVGALGGGNVSLVAGGAVSNVDAVAPTNARSNGFDPATGNPIAATASTLLELGGGNVSVQAGQSISGGVYYVERGNGSLAAGSAITTNASRTVLDTAQLAALSAGQVPDSTTWLPTTLFVGNASFTVAADGDVKMGPVANVFLMPQGINNSFWEKTYFSTYASSDAVRVSSLTGTVTLDDSAGSGGASLSTWYSSLLLYGSGSDSIGQPWLRLAEGNLEAFNGGAAAQIYNPVGAFELMPGTLFASAYGGSINIVGGLTLSPSPTGTLELLAQGAINGLQINALQSPGLAQAPVTNPYVWNSAFINLSDANPALIPGASSPLSVAIDANPASISEPSWWAQPPVNTLDSINVLFNDSSAIQGSTVTLQEQQALHAPGVLHLNDSSPIYLYAGTGDISGLSLYSAKSAQISAGEDITDVSLYLQNTQATDISVVAAGRDVIPYDPTAPLVVASQAATTGNVNVQGFETGDIQVAGPGSLEVLSGRNINLGVGSTGSANTGVGITSIGNSINPYLPFTGANLVLAAGLDGSSGLQSSSLGYSTFIAQFIDPSSAGANATRYLPELAQMEGVTVTTGESTADIWAAITSPYSSLPSAQRTAQIDRIALDAFFIVLRDTGRDQSDVSSPNYGSYLQGDEAIADLFPGSPTTVPTSTSTTANPWNGSISIAQREVATTNGGNIAFLLPGGTLTVGNPSDPQKANQGILTEYGGDISIFAENNVNVGTSRIFTLRGGNEIIWSSIGNIAAGSGSKTVFSAPPTRVLVDPTSGNVENDLAGLATGSGIGVLATLSDVAPGNVDLIAPVGTVDAGDAGIRSSGNLNIAALHVVNASNIAVGGTTSGVPVAAVPNIAGFAAASNSSAATSSAAEQVSNQQQNNAQQPLESIPSIISVDVLGYGGDDDELTESGSALPHTHG